MSARRWLQTHKPTAGERTQFFLAEIMWSAVGVMLMSFGLTWIVQRYGTPGWAYALPFVALGLVKAHFIMDRVARRTVDRIHERGDDHCVGGFFSLSSWALIVGMMLLGQVLRASPVPRADVGFLYVAVGSALVVSSRTFWREWFELSPARVRRHSEDD